MLELAAKLRNEACDQFHAMVKMHLSFLLDLNTDDCDCSFITTPAGGGGHHHYHHHGSGEDKIDSLIKSSMTTPLKRRIFTPTKMTKKSKNLGIMDGVPLTMEGVCQIFQIIEYLSRPHNITIEGIFRKHGSIKKQNALSQRLNKGIPMNLDEGEFSVHEAAAVFKTFLSELPEPLLTDAYYKAHCQVVLLGDEAVEKQIQCLQMLFLLIPQPNYKLLKDTLSFLYKVTENKDKNKMDAANLGTVFATHILCPRKLSAESLQNNHQLLTKAVSFMIENAERLFNELPPQLMTDIEVYIKKNGPNLATPKIASAINNGSSPVVNTVFSFVDREATKKISSETTTDTALAALYAHVQSMPESAQKKKLIAKLNDANGCGTPGVASSSKKARRGLNLTKKSFLLTPRRNKAEESVGGRTASYSFATTPFKTPQQQLHSFKRQNSDVTSTPATSKKDSNQQQQPVMNQKLLSPQSSPAILVSPKTLDNIVSPKILNTPLQSTNSNPLIGTPSGLAVPAIDLATPVMTKPAIPARRQDTVDGKSKRVPPPVPPRMSSLNEKDDSSPITNSIKKMPVAMQESMMTPRCRRPVLTHETLSPCNPPIFETRSNDQQENNKNDSSILPSPPQNYDVEKNNSQDFPPPPPSTTLEDPTEEDVEEEEEESVQEIDNANEDDEEESDLYFASLEDEDDHFKSCNNSMTCGDDDQVRKCLQDEFKKYLEKNNMQTTEDDDEDPEVLEASITSSVISREAKKLLTGEAVLSDSMRLVLDGDEAEPSMLEPVDVDDFIDNEDEENHADNIISTPFNSERLPRKNRKRRSLTEQCENNPLVSGPTSVKTPLNSIYFETDL